MAPLSPSEEHLPIAVGEHASSPQVGEMLHLLPRHVCPTVNNFDFALLVQDGKIKSVEEVSAHGREAPLLPTGKRFSAAIRQLDDLKVGGRSSERASRI